MEEEREIERKRDKERERERSHLINDSQDMNMHFKTKQRKSSFL